MAQSKQGRRFGSRSCLRFLPMESPLSRPMLGSYHQLPTMSIINSWSWVSLKEIATLKINELKLLMDVHSLEDAHLLLQFQDVISGVSKSTLHNNSAKSMKRLIRGLLQNCLTLSEHDRYSWIRFAFEWNAHSKFTGNGRKNVVFVKKRQRKLYTN